MAEVAVIPYNTDFENGDKYGPHEFCRKVEQEFTPFVGKQFVDVIEGYKFYKIYAIACGFDVRLWTQKRWGDGTIQSKLIVCNREGSWESKKKNKNEGCDSITDGRRTKSHRIGCRARMRMWVMNGVVTVDTFNENHNHELVSVENRQFQKLGRRLTKYHKRFIVSNTRLNVGATKTFRICKELVDGFENVGATLNDFKNFQRDVKCFINERDGQLFVDHLRSMKETRPGFYFDYDVDAKGCLRRVIWADDFARKNYAVFGAAVSFDPTYSTNKYSMVFTPFTGVDNHKKSVTFCAALISKEDSETFQWVFERFLFAMGGKEPSYIITDQDPGIIKSVNDVFKTARHRFCMWHIMNKAPSKFGVSRPDYQDFLRKVNCIIWDENITGVEFDDQWNAIMDEYGVGEGDWFSESFDIRRQWVMAHCKDLYMGGVLRTTQRSESENSYFKRFESKSGTLIEFWMRFESAMDQQRYNQRKLENENLHSTPMLLGFSELEKDGARVFTDVIFKEFQDEVKCSMTTCFCKGYKEDGGDEVTSVNDTEKERIYEVRYNTATTNVSCSCGLFHWKGFVCRHVLWILSGHGVKKLPKCLIATRWRKDALKFAGDNIIENGVFVGADADGKKLEFSKLWAEIHEAVGLVCGLDESNVVQLTNLIREFRESHMSSIQPLSKEKEIEDLLSVKLSSDVSILPPRHSKNKGSGKRLTSSKSKAVALAKKPKRLCNNCKQMAHHDRRNCPNPFVASRDDVERMNVDEEGNIDFDQL